MAHAVVVGITVDKDIEAIISSEIEAFWRSYDLRLRQCAKCKPNTAACVNTVSVFSEGILATIRVKGSKIAFSRRDCERFAEFRLSRRLNEAGVGVLLKDTRRSTLGTVSPEADEEFDRFLDHGVDTSSPQVPKQYHLLIEGEKSRAYAVAFLRSSMLNFPNASYRFVHVPTLMRDCRSAMTAKEPNPLRELAEIHVLVLDSVNTEAKKDWFKRELLWLYEHRVDKGLATIITTPKPCKAEEAFTGVTVLKV